MLHPPKIELPQNPNQTEVFYAAVCANNYVEKLMLELSKWREKSHDLFVRADAMKE